MSITTTEFVLCGYESNFCALFRLTLRFEGLRSKQMFNIHIMFTLLVRFTDYVFRMLIFCRYEMRWDGHVARMGEGRGVHRILMGKPEGRRPLGRPRRRWKDNIKMDLQEMGGGCGTGWSWLRIGTSGGHL
jgi:hypothetical protein